MRRRMALGRLLRGSGGTQTGARAVEGRLKSVGIGFAASEGK